MSNFCIVTPFHKSTLNNYEKLSIKTIFKHFKTTDKFLVTFKENKIKIKGYQKIFFDKFFFKNIRNYSLLCNDIEFYKKFIKYDYILICQFDVLVLKNNIEYFINKNLSYIGALAARKNIFDRKREKLWARRFFCNGGFSLRKVIDFIDVLQSNKIFFPINYYTFYEANKSGFINFFKIYLKTLISKNLHKGEYFAKNLPLHEDTFWTYFATLFLKSYKLPTINQANCFAFDGNPYFFYKKNKKKLPIALHGHHDYIKFLKNIGKIEILD